MHARSIAPWFTLTRHEETQDPTPPEGGTEGKPEDGKPEDKRTFTQQELEAILADRLKRQKAQYADYDDVKAKAAKFDEVEQASKSELEREREARTRAEQAVADTTRQSAERIAAAEIKAALSGIVEDPSAIVEDLNLTRYVTDAGDVDAEAVAKLREKYAGLVKPAEPRKPAGNIDQGTRNDGDPADLRNADKKTLDAELQKHGVRRW